MQTIKQILVVAPTAFGYTQHIYKALNRYPGIDVHLVYLDQPAFRYRNRLHRVQNFLAKMVLNKNLKKSFVDDRIQKTILELGAQDLIFCIRPDILTDATLSLLREHTSKFVAYYYDSTRRFPRKVSIKDYFDTVYSYDKQDVATFGFDFLTNYIFDETVQHQHDYLFYNISTHDYRYSMLENLAQYLQERGWSCKMQLYTPDAVKSDYLEIVNSHQSVIEVGMLMDKSKIIVEIQREEQEGLSFRIFEALGKQKKLITTNKDIVHYDFYDPQNIWVLDPQNMHIPETFVQTPYKAIPAAILAPYRLENWVKKVFELA